MSVAQTEEMASSVALLMQNLITSVAGLDLHQAAIKQFEEDKKKGVRTPYPQLKLGELRKMLSQSWFVWSDCRHRSSIIFSYVVYDKRKKGQDNSWAIISMQFLSYSALNPLITIILPVRNVCAHLKFTTDAKFLIHCEFFSV